jgi:hypothetical protein
MAQTPSLYTLSTQYVALLEKLSDGDHDAQTVADTIESTGIVDDISTKAQGVELVARSLEQFDAPIDAEIERLTALKTRRQNAASHLREYLLHEMNRMGIKRIECPFFTIAIRDNPPAVEVFDERQIPKQFMRTPPPKPVVAVPDKPAIGKALRAGQDVPGARLRQGQRIAIV